MQRLKQIISKENLSVLNMPKQMAKYKSSAGLIKLEAIWHNLKETTLIKIIWKLYEARYKRKTVSLGWQVAAVTDNAGKKSNGTE